jgi:hypothetical protein
MQYKNLKGLALFALEKVKLKESQTNIFKYIKLCHAIRGQDYKILAG